MTVILTCIDVKGRKRIRFHSFVDDETGNEYFDAFNKTYNCRFPRKLRQVGKFYCVPDNAITLCASGNRKPCYSVLTSEIEEYDIEKRKIKRKLFVLDYCVICLEKTKNITFLPCGHQCTCSDCYTTWNNKSCPLCRQYVSKVI